MAELNLVVVVIRSVIHWLELSFVAQAWQPRLSKKAATFIKFFSSSTSNCEKMGGDGGFLTPKAIGNRIKAKGLQKVALSIVEFVLVFTGARLFSPE
jgi:hypothetical protein